MDSEFWKRYEHLRRPWHYIQKRWEVLALALLVLLAIVVWPVPEWLVQHMYWEWRKHPENYAKLVDDYRKTLVQIIGGAFLLYTLYLTQRRTKATEETLRVSQETLKVTRETQITDRFTKAVAQLGAADSQGKKQLEIRFGGIYALERIAKDSAYDHWPIMEILTAYVRENAPWQQRETYDTESKERDIRQPEKDIQAIMTVIGRRTKEQDKGKLDLIGVSLQRAYLQKAHLEEAFLQRAHLEEAKLWEAHLQEAHLEGAFLQRADLQRADLKGAYLQRADLQRADLQRADLKGAYLQEADLEGAHLGEAKLWEAELQKVHLKGADLQRADLKKAELQEAHLEGAFLQRADLEEAKLWGAHLEGAHLQEAHLKGADLQRADLKGAYLQRADLKGAYLQEAHLEGAKLWEAHLEGAYLQEAHLEGAKLSKTIGLTQEQLNDALGDFTTKLPPSLAYPNHWPKAPNEQDSDS